MKNGWRIASVVSLTVAAAAPLARAAEPARTMLELEERMKPGTQVDVVDRQGKMMRGDFVRADGEGLLLTTYGGGEGLRIPASDVATVTRHGGDSLWNGALIGAGVGLIGAIDVYANPNAWDCRRSDDGCKAGFAAVSMVLYTGGGMLIDRMIKGRELVYRAPTDRVAFSVVPYPVRQGAGVQFALRY